MTSPHLTDDEILAQARAESAQSEYRALEEAFASVRASLLENIAASPLVKADFRERCYMAVQVLDAAKVALLSVAVGKPIAEHNALIRSILNGKDPVA